MDDHGDRSRAANLPAADDALVRRARDGRREAFEVLVHRHHSVVRGWLVPRCPPGVEADDIVQRTFLVAFQRLPRYAVGTSFRAWLFGIARRELGQECRRIGRLQKLRGDLLEASVSTAQAERIADGADDEEDHVHALRLCLLRLDAAERRLLDQRYRQEYRVRAIAAGDGCPEGTIKKRLYALRRRLAACIERRIARKSRP